MSRRILVGLQIAGTIVLAAFLFRQFDWAAFVDVVRSLTPAFYVGSLAVVAIGQTLFAWRWQVVLKAIGVDVRNIRYRDVLQQYFIGLFFNNLLPTAVGGDAFRVYYLGRSTGYAEAGASVLVDRILGFAWLAFLGAALAWVVSTPSSFFVLNRTLLTLFAAGFAVLLVSVRTLAVERWVPERVAPLVGFIRSGATGPAPLAAGAVAAGIYLAAMTIIYQQFLRLAGVAVPDFAVVMLVIISAGIFVNVPISMNGIGLREQLHYLLFSALGVPKEVAVSLSLLMFFHMLLVSLLGWIAWVRAQAATAPLAPTSAA